MNFNNNYAINIILPPVWSGVYLNISKLLKFSLEDLKIKVNIIEAGEMEEGELSIILGWNLIPDSTVFRRPYIIYQLEPLVLSIWQEKMIFKKPLFEQAVMIWDYSESNASFLIQMGLKAEIVKLGYHPRLQEVSCSQYPDYDVLFVGFITERRKKILEKLQQHCCVSVQPKWGNDFSDALGRSKILLNIHQYDTLTPVEQPRLSYALNNKIFIVSEIASDNPYPALIFSEYKNMVDVVLSYLYDPVKRFDRREYESIAFKEFKMTDILKQVLHYLKEYQVN
jgi:hypothetical protein